MFAAPHKTSIILMLSAGIVPTLHAQSPEITGFERAKTGQFEALKTSLGTWRTTAGKALINNSHAKTGKHCLQLSGAANTTVILELAKPLTVASYLSFSAERWTQRSPFSFRIDKNSGEGWEELFDGDRIIRVGRPFLSQVKLPLLDAGIRTLRFSCTSPADTGILIDDLRIATAQAQRITDVKVVAVSLPALVGTKASPLIKIRIKTTGQLAPISCTGLQARLTDNTKRSDLVAVQIHHTQGPNGRFTSNNPFASLDVAKLQNSTLVFTCPASACPLVEGVNDIWVACQLNDTANIDHQIGAVCRQLTFSNGQTMRLDNTSSIQRIGVAVRQSGDDSVNTYRIPGLVTTNKGTLISVYDARHRSGGDLPGDIDVGISRSTDGGRTWESMQIIMDMGKDPKWRYDGIGDPAILVDRATNTVWVAALWSHGNRGWHGSGPGITSQETGQLMLARSEDDGLTWSKPINITAQVKKPEWPLLLQGPGKGITMQDGTIVFAAQYQSPSALARLPHSTILYSKDHGDTWHIGTGAFPDTTEAQVVEIKPGVLMLNCRYNPKPVRVIMTTSDMGKTWQRHSTSQNALIEPRACMASLIRTGQTNSQDTRRWLLFSNPDSTQGRHHLTIKASPDDGLTWPQQYRLLLDEGLGRGYSCMTMIDKATIGILYEGSQADLTFQRIALADLLRK
jgi:sialidase-1